MNRREEVLSTLRAVPEMPIAVTKLIRLLEEPDVDINDIIKAIELDPGLTSNVLRLANSAYFGGPRTIGSLRDAIVRLGTNRVFQLVMASAISPLARPSVKGYDFPPGELLSHSIATAICTEQLAEVLGLKTPGHAFTAALLHDLGKIVLGTFIEVDARPISALASERNVSFEVAEKEVLGIDHAEVGEMLLDSWNLPHEITAVARWHHEPGEYDGDRLTVDMVHVANRLAIESGIGTSAANPHYHAQNTADERLGLREEQADTAVRSMLAALEEVRGLFLSEAAR
ncbi:MAG TPA: HDOD domain-containing protein [Candidatus Hydrogenedentes bacterium]|nr:HDOD domain-containing protein [Candidatus Hydrogenedentota bacterium]HIJ72661.1 HDOD domain-containing protein [Candidatus Hydrogenedentota bacterium]